jgi:K+/H+ antiporter YhaU regulatory subunit KhtT
MCFMKKLYILLILLLPGIHTLYAQEKNKPNKSTPASEMDQRIADKMKVTLGLEQQQWEKILKINQELSEQKKNAFKSSTDREKVGKELQRIEDERDNKYRSVLSEKQQELYIQKKKYLLSRNE